jgi:hypothetical protein
LGNPKLSRNPCWRDARFECRANGIDLTLRQRDLRDVHPVSSRNLTNCRQLFILRTK